MEQNGVENKRLETFFLLILLLNKFNLNTLNLKFKITQILPHSR
jgi:hypothetical protein